MERLCYVMLCLLGLGLLQTHAFEVTIKDGSNNTCIYASMKINFTIQYETSKGESRNITFAAPDDVTTTGSTCGTGDVAPLLNVGFGNGFSWSLNFTKDAEEYRGSVLIFTYNISDAAVFPDAKEKGLLTSATNSNIFLPVPLNVTYKCVHEDTLITDHVVQLYWDVTLQAYVEDSRLGRDLHCTADTQTTPSPTTVSTSTSPPTTTSPTTTSSTTSTSSPTTPSNTTVTPKPTSKPVDKPIVGNYSVSNGTAKCLLASMGLQLNASQLVEGKNAWTAFNINPDNTTSTGSCGNETALLRLSDSSTDVVVEFLFFTKQKNFHLQEVNVTMKNGSGFIYRTNVNLSLWEASLGNSYLCHKEQLINVSEDLYINTFDVKVQPFGLNNGTYGTAEECFADSDLSFLIPIAVGTVLIFLIILVFISYLIGRRKSRTGYQSV